MSAPPSPRFVRFRRALLGLTVVALAASVLGGSINAQESDRLLDRLDGVDTTDGRQVEAALATVGMDAAWRSALGLNEISRAMVVDYRDGDQDTVDRLLLVAAQVEVIDEQLARVNTDLRGAAVELVDATAKERARRIERNHADVHLRGISALVGAVAIDLFAGNGDSDDELLGSDGQALLIAQRTHELQGHTLEEMLGRRDVAIDELAAAEEALAAAEQRLAEAREEHDRLSEESIAVLSALRNMQEEAWSLLPQAAEGFVLAGVPRERNLTVRALDAYLNAELIWTERSPRCRISWRTIAAIGAVEGAHATFSGREIQIDGTPDEPIIGLPLDGENVDNFGDTVAAIADTDDGRWDEDTEYDRAVGPMQFIPQTWTRWAHDGDGDGEFDPQDLDDAAVAAGGYLCNYGRHNDWEVWKNAVFGYNHSAHYVASVKAAHDRIQRVRLPVVEGVDLWPGRPWGTYVPMPIPEPEPEEGVDPVELTGTDG